MNMEMFLDKERQKRITRRYAFKEIFFRHKKNIRSKFRSVQRNEEQQ